MKFDEIIDSLFSKARNFDNLSEWEYIQTILRDKYFDNWYSPEQVIAHDDIYNSLNSHNTTRNFQRQILDENIDFIWSLINIANEKRNFYDAIRIKLVIYSYITEIRYLQDILMNMLWILFGKTFYLDPFSKEVLEKNLSIKEQESLSINSMRTKTITKSEKRFEIILYLCKSTKQTELEKYINEFYDNHLRNSIYHSKYIFSEAGFIGFDNNIDIKMSYEELTSKLNNCIDFFINIIKNIENHRKSYTKTKRIIGRKTDYKNNNIITDQKLVDVRVIANDRIGIVQTLLSYTEDGKTLQNPDDEDDFLEKLIEFSENYDLILKQNEITDD